MSILRILAGATALFLASPRARFISGAELRVDGGLGPISTGIAPLFRLGARLPEGK